MSANFRVFVILYLQTIRTRKLTLRWNLLIQTICAKLQHISYICSIAHHETIRYYLQFSAFWNSKFGSPKAHLCYSTNFLKLSVLELPKFENPGRHINQNSFSSFRDISLHLYKNSIFCMITKSTNLKSSLICLYFNFVSQVLDGGNFN